MVSYFPPPPHCHSLYIVYYINIAISLWPYQFPKWTLNAPIKPNPKPKTQTQNTNPKLNWYISPQRWAIFQFVGLDTMVLRSQWMLLGVPAAIWHATFFSLSHSPSLSLPTLCFFTILCVIFLRLFFNKFFIVCLSEQKKGRGIEREGKSRNCWWPQSTRQAMCLLTVSIVPNPLSAQAQVVLFW